MLGSARGYTRKRGATEVVKGEEDEEEVEEEEEDEEEVEEQK